MGVKNTALGNDKIEITALNGGAGFGTTWTLLGWMRWDASPATGGVPAVVYDNVTGDFHQLEMSPAMVPAGDGDTWGPTNLTGTWITGVWYFFALRSDGTNTYTDMAHKGDVALTGVSGSSNNQHNAVSPFGDGDHGNADNRISISNCMYYSTTKLSDAQLITQMGFQAPQVTPTAWWKFVDNSTKTVDSQGSNTLTATGTFVDADDPTDWWTPPGPTITVQPTQQVSYSGNTATFNVSATGTGTIHYQWKANGSDVGTDSSSYTTGSLTVADNLTEVYCVVTDDNGSTNTSTVYLIVIGAASLPWIRA